MISNILAFVAVLISIASLLNSRRANRTQEQLSMREIQLVRKQLAQFEREEREAEQANLSARLYKVGKNNWRLKIFNRGPGTAFNVDMKIMNKERSNFQENFFKDILPMKSLESGDSVEIVAVVTMDSPQKEEIGLSWSAASGEDFEKTVEVTH